MLINHKNDIGNNVESKVTIGFLYNRILNLISLKLYPCLERMFNGQNILSSIYSS